MMIFSVVNQDPKNRRILTDLLLSVYPGCVVYELESSANLTSCLREHSVHAVIWDLTQYHSLDLSHLNRIKAQYPTTLFLICAEDDTLLEEAMWNGANMYFVKPLLPHQVRSALATMQKV